MAFPFTTFPVLPARKAQRLRGLLARLRRACGGSIAAEFAMAMPVMILIALGGSEIARYALLSQKLARTAVTMADLVSQAETLTESDVTQLFAAVTPVMEPFTAGSNEVVIVSSIAATGGNPPKIGWQRMGGGTLTGETSKFGSEGADADLPSGFVVRDGESVIVAEVYYDYAPLFTAGIVGEQVLYHRAMFRPRFGSLAALSP